MSTDACIRHPLLEGIGVDHGFGTRESIAPADVLRPMQVHGADVLCAESDSQGSAILATRADAIVCASPGRSIAVVTADCVPILASCESGHAVAAIHAGWRGLAAGVVEAGIEALRASSPEVQELCAVIGPHIGQCCYEVDEPVIEAMARRFGDEAVADASVATSAGHAQLSLASLVEVALERAGVGSRMRERLKEGCTHCETRRFHSFRRDGTRAGRMTHFIATAHQ